METIASHIGWLLKIDDYISSLSRSKFSHICVEIKLTKSLKQQGVWNLDDDHQVFVVILYEKVAYILLSMWVC